MSKRNLRSLRRLRLPARTRTGRDRTRPALPRIPAALLAALAVAASVIRSRRRK